MTNAHGYDTKRAPLTPAQGRVLYHAERLFKGTGGGRQYHAPFVAAVERAGLNPYAVATYTDAQCVLALEIMERACAPLAPFRPVDTGRADFMPGGRFYRDGYARPHDALGVT